MVNGIPGSNAVPGFFIGWAMLNWKMIGVLVAAAFGAALVLRLFAPGALEAPKTNRGEVEFRRIVSMAPGITETLYAVGAGDRVIGVTRYCTFPPEAQEKADIGGLLDPSYETIVTLEPDLVVIYPFQDEAREKLKALGIVTLTVDHRTLNGILQSIALIGAATGHRAEAEALLGELNARANRVAERTAELDRPTVLVSAGRDKGTGQLTEIYASGQNTWYNSMLEMAGGTNAYTDRLIQFPTIGIEGLIDLDPDIIVEMVRANELQSFSEADIVAEWGTVPQLRAVKEKRVYVLSGDYTTVPGPRFVIVLEDLARALHPEAGWDAP